MRITVEGEGAHRWASKKAMMMAARPMEMATATKRAMANNHDNTCTGNGKEGGERATVEEIPHYLVWMKTGWLPHGEGERSSY
jgi:hypothetical protein